MDELKISNLRLYAYHGCHDEERKIGAWFNVSVTVCGDMQSAIKSDLLKNAVDYVWIKNIIEQEMAIPSNLIEHVAGRIAEKIKQKHALFNIEVTICKEAPPFAGNNASVSVKIKR